MPVIYLQPEQASTPELEDDTFWLWFKRTFESSFEIPDELGADDVLLHYGALGHPRQRGGKKIALLWELYPEMKRQGFAGLHVEEMNAKMYDAYESCDLSLVSCETMLEFFPKATVLPIGVDTEVFRPNGKTAGAIWCGSGHPMKGRDIAEQWAISSGQDLLLVSKGDVKQRALAKLLGDHSELLLTSRLRPLYMVEWEALSAGCKPIDISPVRRDPLPLGDPRGFVFESGWSRDQVREQWRETLA